MAQLAAMLQLLFGWNWGDIGDNFTDKIFSRIRYLHPTVLGLGSSLPQGCGSLCKCFFLVIHADITHNHSHHHLTSQLLPSLARKLDPAVERENIK